MFIFDIFFIARCTDNSFIAIYSSVAISSEFMLASNVKELTGKTRLPSTFFIYDKFVCITAKK